MARGCHRAPGHYALRGDLEPVPAGPGITCGRVLALVTERADAEPAVPAV
ncbi:hypothetical protein ACFU67_14820 [Streptomyces rhizosphaericola]